MNTYKSITKAVALLNESGVKVELVNGKLKVDKKGLRELEYCSKHNVQIAKRGLKATSGTQVYDACQLSDGSFGVYIYGNSFLVSAKNGKTGENWVEIISEE